MTNLFVIPPVEFKQRQNEQLDNALEKSVITMIQHLLMSHACFQDDGSTFPIKVTKRYNNFKHNVSNSHALRTRQVSSYKERLDRDLNSYLNKINRSNSHVIQEKILKMVNKANVEQITLNIIGKACRQDLYTALFIQLLHKLAKDFEESEKHLHIFSNDFVGTLLELFQKAESLDYSCYDEFCKFGVIKQEILSRQVVLQELIRLSLVSFDSSQYLVTLMQSLDKYMHLSNQHMFSIVLALCDGLCEILESTDHVKGLCTALSNAHNCDVALNIGKKNQFVMERILQKFDSNI